MQVLTENRDGFRAMLRANPGMVTDVAALQEYAQVDADHGAKPMQMVREAATLLLTDVPAHSPRAAMVATATAARGFAATAVASLQKGATPVIFFCADVIFLTAVCLVFRRDWLRRWKDTRSLQRFSE